MPTINSSLLVRHLVTRQTSVDVGLGFIGRSVRHPPKDDSDSIAGLADSAFWLHGTKLPRLTDRYVGAQVYLQSMRNGQREPIGKLICPGCHKVGVIVRILWGMPEEDFDYLHFASGGCIMQGGGLDPDVQCRECDWSGFRNELDSLLSKELLDMRQRELLDDEGGVIYYWDVTDVGVHFEIEIFGDPGSEFSMDSEFQFTVPKSEFPKIYAMFGIDPANEIDDAILEISDSGRGLELSQAFENSIQVIDKFVWIS